MASNESSTGTHVTGQQTRRVYWRRREGRVGWGASGWLPLAGLIGVLAYGILQTAPAIEAQTAAEVRSALDALGLDEFDVAADGQDVLIRARGAESRAAEIAALASVTACDTWIAGRQTCPLDVRVLMSGETPVVAVEDDVESESPARLHNFDFRQSEGVLTLNGEVPDQETRQAIVTVARQSFESVADNLSVSGESATDAFDWAVDRAWPALAAITEGGVVWQDGKLSVSGEIAGSNVADVRRSLSVAAFADRIGDIDLRAAPLADICTEQFSAALSRSTIQFRTGSAEIAAASGALLDELAQIARQCPMALSIEGHTDNSGPAEFNRFLSRARAEAVVAALAAAGIDESRLVAEGFGAERPIADNATASGRALNRRIEIKVMEQGGGE